MPAQLLDSELPVLMGEVLRDYPIRARTIRFSHYFRLGP